MLDSVVYVSFCIPIPQVNDVVDSIYSPLSDKMINGSFYLEMAQKLTSAQTRMWFTSYVVYFIFNQKLISKYPPSFYTYNACPLYLFRPDSEILVVVHLSIIGDRYLAHYICYLLNAPTDVVLGHSKKHV
jgi:hypothetical protein